MGKPPSDVHVYDANLRQDSQLQEFFEGDSLVVATRFFRNRDIFNSLQQSVIPRLLATGLAKRGRLHIWSAGCSDGREAYSLAMAARHVLDTQGHQKIAVSVRGSDLSRPQIEIARRGEYKVSAHDLTEMKIYADYFHHVTDELVQVDDQIKGLVDFRVENIIEAVPSDAFDILICNLVVLYYDPEYQKEILLHLLSTLRPDGFFHVAPVGRRWLRSRGFDRTSALGPFFYRVAAG